MERRGEGGWYSYQNVQKFQLIERSGQTKPKTRPNEAKVKQTTEITIFFFAGNVANDDTGKKGVEKGAGPLWARGVNCCALFENR